MPPLHKPQDPPDGGYGWVVAICGTFILIFKTSFFAVFGVVFMDLVEHYNTSKVVISWLAALQQFLMGVSGLVYGPLIRKYGPRSVGILAPILVVLGYLSSALCSNVAYLFITYSLFLGIGLGAYEAVTMPAVMLWFAKHRSLVMSFNLSGYSLGAFIWPPLVTVLVDEYTWKGAFIIVAGIQLQTMVLIALLRSPDKPKSNSEEIKDKLFNEEIHDDKKYQQEIPDIKVEYPNNQKTKKSFCSWLTLFKDPSFSLLFLGIFCLYTNHIVTLSYTTIRGVMLGHSKTDSAFLSSLLGLGNLVGRLSGGFLSTKLRTQWHVHVCALFTLITGLLSVTSLASDVYWFLAVYCTLWGVTTGICILYSMSGVVAMFDATYGAEIIGFYLTIAGSSFFITNIIAGVILDMSSDPTLLVGVSGAVQCLGGIILSIGLCVHRCS